MIVKVCGVRSAAIARAAIDAGADWIGLVFEPRSPRHADDAAAAEVVEAVAGAADLVGVMVAPSPRRCDQLAARWGLAAVQVHGEVGRELVEECDVPVIRAINVGSAAAAFRFDWWPDGMVLLDAAPEDAGGLPGGTGRELSTAWAADVARHRPVILAGGLRPESVAAAIAAVRPRGVDASSGLESAPGVKDAGRVVAYVRAAREAAARLTGAAPGSPG